MARPSSSPPPSGGTPVTLAVVAERAGVSRQTVSNAINSPELLRPETLERVRRVIDQTGYRPSRAAQALRTRASRLIGYGVPPARPGAHAPVMDQFLHALSDAADAAGYRIVLFATPEGGDGLDRYAALLDEHDIDGFVLSETRGGDPRQAWLSSRGLPFVAFGRLWSGRQIGDWVDVDGARGTEAAVDHLAGLGHRRIAFLGWPRGSGVGDDRADGWSRAMRRHGLTVRGLRSESVDDVAAAQQAATGQLEAGATAVVAASDVLALGVYRTLAARGTAPGQGGGAAVVGFDDSPTAAVVAPGLTTLAQPLDAVGRECVRLLLARIADPSAAPERVLLEPRLVIRGSSGGTGGTGSGPPAGT